MKKFVTLGLALICAFFIVGCQTGETDKSKSPSETLQALNEASKKKDTAAIKNLLSKGTLDLLEANAKKQDKSIDEILLKDDGAPFQDLPEMRNEKINGETATVEVKNTVTSEYQSIPFVKENGIWKVALDKFLEEVMKKMREEMNQMPAMPTSPDNSNQNKPEVKNSNTNPAENKK